MRSVGLPSELTCSLSDGFTRCADHIVKVFMSTVPRTINKKRTPLSKL
jgi:hypothetical protein